jgi:hypothetical protein
MPVGKVTLRQSRPPMAKAARGPVGMKHHITVVKISGHLTTEAEIDEFVDDALAELEEIRIAAKKALGQHGAR